MKERRVLLCEMILELAWWCISYSNYVGFNRAGHSLLWIWNNMEEKGLIRNNRPFMLFVTVQPLVHRNTKCSLSRKMVQRD